MPNLDSAAPEFRIFSISLTSETGIVVATTVPFKRLDAGSASIGGGRRRVIQNGIAEPDRKRIQPDGLDHGIARRYNAGRAASAGVTGRLARFTVFRLREHLATIALVGS